MHAQPSLHFWDEAKLIVVDALFDVLLNSVLKYFIEMFGIYVHQRDCPKIGSLSDFNIRVILLVSYGYVSVPFISSVWNILRSRGVLVFLWRSGRILC